MNTRFSYMYRDACNYKKYNDYIVTGVVSITDIECYLHEGEYFIPSEIGFEDLQGDSLNSDDHIWHELVDISETKLAANIELSSADLLNNFRKSSKSGWNEFLVYKRKGML